MVSEQCTADIREMPKEQFLSVLAEMVANYIETNKPCEINVERQRVDVEDAAKILGMTSESVRYFMRENRFNPPIGYVDKLNGETGRKEYRIYRHMLNKHIGIEE